MRSGLYLMGSLWLQSSIKGSRMKKNFSKELKEESLNWETT